MIKLQKYYVTDGVTKVRVFYSNGQIYARDAEGKQILRDCVTLYAKDYGHGLRAIFGAEYENNSDSMTDYFEQGHVRIFPGSPLYFAAKARAAEQSARYRKAA